MTGLTFILTDACNQGCSYCYQIRKPAKMKFETARKTIDFFSSKGDDEVEMHFYGGEPFLAYDLMQEIISYSTRKFTENGIQYMLSVTTNGTLLNEERMSYCLKHGVDIYISIDGIKEAHEAGRGKGSFENILKVLDLYHALPEMKLITQTLVTPDNVQHLYRSVCWLVSQGVCELNLNYVYDHEWQPADLALFKQQYQKSFNYLMQVRAKGKKIKFKQYKKPSLLHPLFHCDAGKNRLTVTPEGVVYGCAMLRPWSKKAKESGNLRNFNKLYFNHVDELSWESLKMYGEKLNTDKRLRSQFHRYTDKQECRDCKFIGQCSICPVYAMVIGKEYLLVPDWICEINKFLMETH